MIATLRGEIIQIEDNALVLEVGGVGLRVFVPAPVRTRMKVGEVLMLYTHLVVREDALMLYGFDSQPERELFNILGKINREDKVTILVVEQNAQLALELADQAYVIETGKIVMSGAAKEIASNEDVRKSYLGY